jgi:hypothetical protein
MPGKLSFVVAIAATLVIPTAAWSGGKAGSSGGHREDAHRDSGRIGGAAMNHAPMKNFGAAASSSAVRGSAVVQGSNNAAQNVVAPGAATSGGPRQAFYDRRHFHHRHFFGTAFFAGPAIGYADDGPCWQWAEIPTASGWTRQQVWVCDDDERGDRDNQ